MSTVHREARVHVARTRKRHVLDWREAPPVQARRRSDPLCATLQQSAEEQLNTCRDTNSECISLVVEDPAARSRLHEFISGFGFAVSGSPTVAEASREWVRRAPAVCVVDLEQSALDPGALIREVSGNLTCPVITMSSRADLSDRVLFLELGADDYLIKPVEPRELVAKIRCMIRRSKREQTFSHMKHSHVQFGQWTLNVSSLELHSESGRAETLTAAEADLLLMLLRSPNRLLTREQIQSDQIFADDLALERSIDVRISRIRKKIECDARAPRFIKTVYGGGYMFTGEVTWK